MKNLYKSIISLVNIYCYCVIIKLYMIFKDSYLAKLSTLQVNDSIITYSLVRQLIETNIIVILITIMFIVSLILIWKSNILKLFKKEKHDQKT
jgi:hypothetical protein